MVMLYSEKHFTSDIPVSFKVGPSDYKGERRKLCSQVEMQNRTLDGLPSKGKCPSWLSGSDIQHCPSSEGHESEL